MWYGENESEITALSDTVIVNSVARTIDSDGTIGYSVEYTKIGTDTQSYVTTTDSSLVSGMAIGDVIKIAIDGTKLKNAALVYDISEDKLYDTSGNVSSGNYVTQAYGADALYYQANLGIVYDRPEDSAGMLAIFEEGSTEDYRVFSINNSTKYYKLELDSHTNTSELITEYTIDDIISYTDDTEYATKVLVIAYEGYAKGIYIIE